MGRDAFTVCYAAAELSVDRIQQAISELGFKARLVAKDAPVVPPQPKNPADAPEPIAGALAKARESNRLVFVDFFAEWCAPCKVLEADIFPEPKVQKAMEAYVFVKVDTDEFPAAGEHFDVAAMPTLLALDGAGKELHRWIGMVEAQDLAKRLMELGEAAGGDRKPVSKGNN